MASQNVLIKPVGLYSYPSHLAAVPQGALLKADNVFVNRDNIVESRRGFKLYGSAMDLTAHQLLTYKNRLIRHFGSGSGTTLEYDSDGSGTFTEFNVALSGTKHSSVVVDGITSTEQLEAGMYVTGPGIPLNTTIASIDSNVQITLSSSATDSNTDTLTFSWNISEVEQGRRIRNIESNGNLYFTSIEGIRKISLADDSWPSSPAITLAGGIKALDVALTINSNPGFLLPQSVVAYRIVWGINDSNNNLILGTPSSRTLINNSSDVDSKTVDLQITIPQGVTTAYFYQVYRTAVVSNVNSFQISGDLTTGSNVVTNVTDTSSLAIGMSITDSNSVIPSNTTIDAIISTTEFTMSANATGDSTGDILTISQLLNQDPGDEQQLVYEANPTVSDLTNGYVSTTDITPESFRVGGANLYTNQNSGEGILQSNDVPPLSKDITEFKGYTFYANTSTKQRLNISLLSVSAFVSQVSSFTITDGTTSNTYTFRDVADGGEDAATKNILISDAGTPAQQVDESARSLVHVINSQSSELVYAYYLSGPSDVPGLILLESRKLNQAAFYLNVDDDTTTGVEFSPALTTSGNSVISTNEVSPNRIYYSKFQQPEAVPIVNFIDVGPKDKAIQRIIALRDSLYVLKDDGIYRLSGLVSPFTIYPFDFSVIIKAPDSAVVLNNLIYLYSTQGIGRISDTGIEVISRPIEDIITKLLIPSYTSFKTSTFGVAYESDRSYYLFTVTSTSDTYATQCLRFNTFTSTWTRQVLSKSCGIVNSFDDRLYLGATDVNYVEQERKSFDRTDFSDRELSLNLGSSAISGTSITLPSLVNIAVGDVLVQTQYLTIKQFNRLLSKLDNDNYLSPHDYVSSASALPGDNLSNDLDALIVKIRDDAGRTSVSGATDSASYTALVGLGASSFSDLQTNFNSLISLLNADSGLSFKNYKSSSNTTDYELGITSINKLQNYVGTTYQYPLIEGPLTIYNHINVELQFVPQYFQDVSMTKHVSEGTLIFEDSSFSIATLSYASDLSANFEDQDVSGNGNGIFGNNLYGQGIFGGNGSGIPFRTLLPKEKQRCRYINVKFKHNIGREIFSLYGLSLTYNVISNRGWR